MRKSKIRNTSGITLVALVVTIVILIILATISMNVIFGKNGLVNRAKEAKEKHQIEAAREKLVIKLTDLQTEAIENGKKLTLEDLIIINTTEKDMKVETTTIDKEGNEIEEKVVRYEGEEEGEKDYTKVTVDGYVFKVDDDFGVTYIDPKTDPEKGPGYNGGDADDELGDGGIILDKDKEHDPNADKLHDTVPPGWIGIYNEEDLINMKNDLSKKYILMADIPLTKPWIPLGDSKTEFTGYLNGNGRTITNMNISGTEGYLGMFARTSGTAYISNLNIKDYTLTGSGKYIGGLVGYNKGNIRGVSFNGNLNINGEASYVGGLVGFHRYDSKTTTGIERVYTGGTLNAPQGTCVGGIVGLMEGYSEKYNNLTYIKNSYSTMTTTGNEHVGGLVGEMRYSHLENTYTIGKVTGKKNTGGVVATVNNSCYAKNTYWGKGITTQKTSALGMIQTMPKLGKQATYNNYDFATVWGIDENETTAYLLGMEVPGILREIMEGYVTQQGDGTEENPYEIWTEEQLYNVRNNLEAYYIVMADLDLSEYDSWSPIGTSSRPFIGNFNGNGHTIENMTIKNCGNNSGLFGVVGKFGVGASVYELTLDNYNISGSSSVDTVGGLVGCVDQWGYIGKVYANGTINLGSSASSNIGGIAGFMAKASTMEQCYAGGDIIASGASNIGGLVGGTAGSTDTGGARINNCFSTVNVKGDSYVSGLVGSNVAADVLYCYAAGKVEGNYKTAGVFVDVRHGSWSGSGSYCYWNYETTGQLGGELNCSMLEFKNTIKKSSYGGFDFANIWAIEEGSSMPYLQGMKVPDAVYDIIEEYGVLEGRGTSADPYLVHNAKELRKLRYDMEHRYYYKLANDIDLSTYGNWEPIGTEEVPFTGNLDGNGYTIKNMKIEGSTTTALGGNVGLFGFTYKAAISNLILEDYTITGAYEYGVGGLVGYSAGGTITKVYTKGNINLSNKVEASYVGGLVGQIDYDGTTTITQCYTEGSVNVPKGGTVGGLVGWTQGGDRRVTVENSYTNTQVTANDGAGGLIGAATLTNINYCYAVGKVQTVGEVVGGLVGDIDTSSATSSYWSAELTGQLNSALGINTATSNLTKQEVYSGWNFSTIWSIEEGQSFAYLQGMLIPDMVYDKVKEHGTMDGTGTTAKPYIITTAEELNKVRYDLKGNYRLGANIDLSGITKWTPIGTETAPFTGTFDGAGYTISNMKITGSTTENLGTDIGLFGWIDRATIKNVAIENYNITGGSGERVGGLVGYGLAPTITNVYTNGTISLAYNRRDSNQIGGLIGLVDSSDGTSAQISQCYAGGSITTQVGWDVGGLVGCAQGTVRRVYIQNSYSTANVNGNSNASVGGLVGAVVATTIENSYTIGKVQGKGNGIGGVVGYVDDGRASNTYWSEELTGQVESEIGIKITASKLTQQGGYSGWNFTTIWSIEEGQSFAYLQGMKVPDAVTEKTKETPIMEGLGTSSSPYIITSAEQLNMIKYDLKGYYKLGSDIDLTSITRWTPIGTEEAPFTGNFNGDGHTISNMKIDVGTSSNIGDNVGLFGYTNGGAIQNVTLENYKLNGGYGNNIGALIGNARGTAVTKVYTKGSIYLGRTSVESWNIGGVVGCIEAASSMTISQCHTEGTITANGANNVGGILGVSEGDRYTTVQNSYVAAQVSGCDGVGGIIGWADNCYVNYCYAIGKITAKYESVGGLLGGYYNRGSATSSYWNTATSGQEEGVIGTGRDTATMQTVSNYSGWSTTIWKLEEGKYPTLL